MKRSLLLCTLALPVLATAQTTLFTETFESGTAGQFTLNSTDMSSTATGVNYWAVNNAYAGGSASFVCMSFPFTFTVPASPAQPAGITASPNSYYMHLVSTLAADDGIVNSNYAAAEGLCVMAENNFTKMSADISTMGYTGVSLSFWWACGGSTTNFGEVYYSTDGGTIWTKVTTPVSNYNLQSSWTQQTIALPVFDNQASLRFGFRFVNNTTSSASEPAFQLDDIKITGNGCMATGSTQTPTICQGSSYFAEGANQTVSGTYYDTLVNACGMDSVVTTNLTVTPVDVSITVGGASILAGATGATYQWMDCGTNMPIAGETNQTYTPGANGYYAAIITQSGCTDTTTCELFTGLDLQEHTTTSRTSVYPNPSLGIIHVSTQGTADQVMITDLTGKIVQTVKPVTGITTIDLGKKAHGLYFVTVKQQGSQQTFKVAVN